MLINALTVDLEDWYHICGTEDNTIPSKWVEYESRVTRNTDKVLSLLMQHDAKATFFVLGCIAEKEPDLIRTIHRQGHEIAIHGYYHQRLFELSRDDFEEDVKKSIAVVEAITGEKVFGYRAPEWSIRNNTLWALGVLRKLGIKYDSSMVPLTRMGGRGFERHPPQNKNQSWRYLGISPNHHAMPLGKSAVYRRPPFKDCALLVYGF